MKSREGDPAESLMLKMEAMKIVNKRLDEGEEGISDGTIGAVTSMVTYEVFNYSYMFDIILDVQLIMYQANDGSLYATRTHMNGLGRMVALRRGFKNAGCPPSLQRLIAWSV